MSGPGAGFEYPAQEVSWLKRDVLLFAVSIGCTVDELHFIYVCALLFEPNARSNFWNAGTPPRVCSIPNLRRTPS